MKLGMKAQYAVLFVLFLQQKGQAKTYDAAKSLDLSISFLEQVARKLRIAGIVKSVRGPGGGYQVIGEPTVGQVLAAADVEPFIEKEQVEAYLAGGTPERAFLEMIDLFTAAIGPVLNEPVSNLSQMLRTAELRPVPSQAVAS